MDYTVYGILQARILEWVAFPFSRRSSQPKDRTQVSLIACNSLLGDSMIAQSVKNPSAMQETPVEASVYGLGRSSGEGIGYPLQYSWAFLVAQMVENLPTMWET